MSLTLEQLIARQAGFGGSDAASVLGVNPFMTPLELYESKVNKIISVDIGIVFWYFPNNTI